MPIRISLIEMRKFQSYGEIESNRRFIVAELLNLKLMRRYLWKNMDRNV